ncbi:tetratricopeptide repeat protein [Bosea sp. (in: a-proteobacteria)]|uniref:tetratricopeptide repeat protein n=1 Tax=Bosea sp. (in: a-proteobacteria) TaxID=1871050 RepID=UPI003B3B4D7A
MCRPASTAEAVADPQAVIERHDRALAACDRLIASGGLAGEALADALLTRADLLAPGSGDRYRRALADYDRAIALRPQAAAGYARRSKAHLLYMRDLERALRDIDRAIGLDASNADFLVTRASIRSSLGKPRAALVDLDRAIALAPDVEHAWSLRGLTRLGVDELKPALADFDEAVRLSPRSPDNYLFRADVRRRLGDAEGAQRDRETAMKLLAQDLPATR